MYYPSRLNVIVTLQLPDIKLLIDWFICMMYRKSEKIIHMAILEHAIRLYMFHVNPSTVEIKSIRMIPLVTVVWPLQFRDSIRAMVFTLINKWGTDIAGGFVSIWTLIPLKSCLCKQFYVNQRKQYAKRLYIKLFQRSIYTIFFTSILWQDQIGICYLDRTNYQIGRYQSDDFEGFDWNCYIIFIR